jgi:hypothetical protein
VVRIDTGYQQGKPAEVKMTMFHLFRELETEGVGTLHLSTTYSGGARTANPHYKAHLKGFNNLTMSGGALSPPLPQNTTHHHPARAQRM